VKPVVAIVGRTNVGKSTLFNRFARRRYAIMDDEAGCTRDRLYADVDFDGRLVTFVDTGGLVDAPAEWLRESVAGQALTAMQEADLILFLVDGRAGLLPTDREVAELVRRSDKPTVLVINKMESPKSDPYEFTELGFERAIPVSAREGNQMADLLEAIEELLPAPEEDAPEEPLPYDFSVAIVGRPNVGKSSLLNALSGDERSMVSDVPGTTRDAIDTLVEMPEYRVLLTDTAGMRRKSKVEGDVEYYSVVRALRAVDRSDMVLLVLDAREGVAEQDERIAGYAHEAGKLVILVANKWDLMTDPAPLPDVPYHLEDALTPAEKRRREKLLRNDFRREVERHLPFIAYSPILYTSALHNRGLDEIFPQLKASYEQYTTRVSTSKLNRVILDAAIEHAPPNKRGRRMKVYYATQAESCPPTIVLFVNDPDLMHFGYERYLRNRVREAFGLTGTPIRFVVRPRSRDGENS
jgi:GTPase